MNWIIEQTPSSHICLKVVCKKGGCIIGSLRHKAFLIMAYQFIHVMNEWQIAKPERWPIWAYIISAMAHPHQKGSLVHQHGSLYHLCHPHPHSDPIVQYSYLYHFVWLDQCCITCYNTVYVFCKKSSVCLPCSYVKDYINHKYTSLKKNFSGNF